MKITSSALKMIFRQALVSSVALLGAFVYAASDHVAETNVIDGVTYVCEDGLCRMIGDSPQISGDRPQATIGDSPQTAIQKTAENGEKEAISISLFPALTRGLSPTRMICGRQDARDFVAFLENAPVRDPLAGHGLLVALLLALLGGLAMNLTPCVLPMIPVNLLVIGRSAARGGWYGLGIVLTYGTLGLLAAVGGLAFGTVQSHPVFHVAVGLVFLVLGLALSGVFSIDLSRHRRGLHGGAFAMGIVSALLAGACVAPILVSVLALTAKLFAEGSRTALALPFAVGLGLALPWPLLGAGLQVLPKPGPWMRWVNRAFAVVVFALAVREGVLAWQATAASGEATSPSLRAEVDAATFAARGIGDLKRPVFVDCGASWCGNCAAMDRLLERDPSVRAALGRFTVLRVRAEDLGELRRAPGFEKIPGLPCFAIYE